MTGVTLVPKRLRVWKNQPVSVQQRLSSSHYYSCQRLWTQLLSLIMITDIGQRHNVAALVFFLFWSILLAGSSRVRGWLPGSKFLFPHCICLLGNLKWPRLCWQCQNHLRQGVYIHRKEQYQLNRWTGATDWGLPWRPPFTVAQCDILFGWNENIKYRST